MLLLYNLRGHKLFYPGWNRSQPFADASDWESSVFRVTLEEESWGWGHGRHKQRIREESTFLSLLCKFFRVKLKTVGEQEKGL